MLASTVNSAQAAASIALDQLRALLAFVRANAAWIGELLDAKVVDLKCVVVDLLLALLDEGAAAPTVPSSVADEDERTAIEERDESAAAAKHAECATAVQERTITATVADADADAPAPPIAVEEAGDCDAPAATPTAERRCIVVFSTWTEAAHGALGTAAATQLHDILRDLRIPVEKIVLDSVVHETKLNHYKAICGEDEFPQFFVEDMADGGNCVFLPREDLEEMAHWNGGEDYPPLTDEQYDELFVRMEHRAEHVFKGVRKDKIGIFHQEDVDRATRAREEAAARQNKATEEGLAEEDDQLLQQLKSERGKTAPRSQKKKKKTTMKVKGATTAALPVRTA